MTTIGTSMSIHIVRFHIFLLFKVEVILRCDSMLGLKVMNKP